jgi:hypothetical protein
MPLTRKNLMVDAEQLAELAARRGLSESAAIREAIEAALFVDEFEAAMDALEASGYGRDEYLLSVDEADRPELAKRAAQPS